MIHLFLKEVEIYQNIISRIKKFHFEMGFQNIINVLKNEESKHMFVKCWNQTNTLLWNTWHVPPW